MSDSMDYNLKGWARWVLMNQVDRSVGWSGKSPLCSFGGVSSGWSGDVPVWELSGNDWEAFDKRLKQGLGGGEYELLKTFYVIYSCQLRKTARHCSMSPTTLRRYLDIILKRATQLFDSGTESTEFQ